MGMFDKDEFFQAEQLDKWAIEGQPFILWGVSVTPSEINTSIGKAFGGILEVSTLENPENRDKVSTFASAIVSRIRDAEESDFPCVVKVEQVPGSYNTDATILTLVEPYNPTEGKGASTPETQE